MKCFSLFSGIGGFDLAARNLGHEIIGACEIDKYARYVYAKHFPGVPIYQDATKINPDNLPDFDILVAGFPCQSFSIAGKRRGFDDTRGTLFFEIARIAQKKRPQYMLLENVKGLLSHERGKTIREIYRVLDELGYDTESRIINTKDFLPQNRERIFIIATLRGTSTREIFPLRESIKINNKSRLQTEKERKRIQNQTSGTIDANYHKGEGSRTMIVTHQSKFQQNRIYNPKEISQTLSSNGGGWGAKTGIYNIKQRVRRLTPTECSRLQGFSDNYTEGISDTQRYRCLGNAVTVPVVQYILSHITRQTKDSQEKVKN